VASVIVGAGLAIQLALFIGLFAIDWDAVLPPGS
jgi:hypothetical protein